MRPSEWIERFTDVGPATRFDTEIVLRFWGGCANAVQAAYGLRADHYYLCASREQGEAIMAALRAFASHGLASVVDVAPLPLERVVMVVTLRDEHGEVVVRDDNGLLYDDGYQESGFLWEEGNYSCDCNRRRFIEHARTGGWPDSPCGDEVKLVGWTTEPMALGIGEYTILAPDYRVCGQTDGDGEDG